MNHITLAGTIIKKPYFSHVNSGENFYKTEMATERLSGTLDVIPLVIPEIYVNDFIELEKICIEGEIRQRNVDRHLEINVLVTEVTDYSCDKNFVTGQFYICKEPVYRETPLGRQVTDLLLASHRKTGGVSDYIPCICWGRTAQRAGTLPVGTMVFIEGRLQSRDFQKEVDGEIIDKKTYEVSIRTLGEDVNENDYE